MTGSMQWSLKPLYSKSAPQACERNVRNKKNKQIKILMIISHKKRNNPPPHGTRNSVPCSQDYLPWASRYQSTPLYPLSLRST